MNFPAFRESISSRPPENLYYFCGSETYFIKKGKEILARSFAGGEAELIAYDGKQMADISGFLADAKTPSLLSPGRVMVFDDVDKVKNLNIESLEKYCSSPSKDVIAVFISSEPDKRKKLHKLLETVCSYVETSPLEGRELDSWIKSFLSEQGYSMDGAARNLLTELIGSNLFRLESELTRIMLAAGDRKKLTPEDLDQTTRSSSHAVFDITDAIGDRDCSEALKILKHMIDDGSDPVYQIMPIMRWKFRQLITAKSAQLEGKKDADIIKTAKAWYFKDRFMRQLKKFSVEELQRCFVLFNEADIKMKSHPTKNTLLMEKLIVDLCRGK